MFRCFILLLAFGLLACSRPGNIVVVHLDSLVCKANDNSHGGLFINAYVSIMNQADSDLSLREQQFYIFHDDIEEVCGCLYYNINNPVLLGSRNTTAARLKPRSSGKIVFSALISHDTECIDRCLNILSGASFMLVFPAGNKVYPLSTEGAVFANRLRMN